jgi:hypothetical protein
MWVYLPPRQASAVHVRGPDTALSIIFTSTLDAPMAIMPAPLLQNALVNVGVFATPNVKHTMKCIRVPSFGIWLPPTIL